ncbi:energy transducer TonB [Sandaracinobacter sp. RS1-74]|uniref:energy transducer TonB n=1 Tax=Sandaracinobacteroides sayramensis TaxID=2913411 RepID=UPI001EDA6CEA|nr:energy transducer TonB [Sandaracinobacteroides sayramensis]MCG2842118.1 energy transducer TonB [Sandaracinobacteroides sayramensis]
MLRSKSRPHPRRRRAIALALVLGAHALAFWFLLRPMAIQPPLAEDAMILLDIREPPPPPPPLPEAPPEPEGQSAPEAPKAKPSPIAAPKPEVVVPPPEPVPTPPAPAEGPDALSGAAARDLGGSAAGGAGIGSGLGKAGAATGGGGGTRARRIAGNIVRADFPRTRSLQETGGSTTAHFEVGADGRARNCRVVGSSGHAERDRITCRLIEERFRYEPARDSRGNPVPDIAGWRQDWWPER